MKRLLAAVAVILAAIAALIAFTLPPRAIPLNRSDDGTIAGVLHIHTNRSDGQGDPETVAAAAARAGLRFIVFADHGDATRKPDPPVYRSGVLCLDGVEVSTNGGHYVAFDMPAAPYPFGGDARDVVEDVKRLGGFGIAAHPDSPKSDLRWREWTAPFDGIELLNLDTGWRYVAQEPGVSSKWRLARAIIDYPFRAPEVIAGLVHPSAAIFSWEALTRRRRVVAIAGADAHARLVLRASDSPSNGYALPVPGYESSFRVASVHVRTERPLTGDAAGDAAILVRALRAGHLYVVLDGIATPPAFDFTATNEKGSVREGDELGAGGAVLLHVRSNAPLQFTTIVWEGSKALFTGRDASDLMVHGPDTPGVFWVEIIAPGPRGPVTWIRSNPIYVRGADAYSQPPGRVPALSGLTLFDGKTANGWRVEHDPESLAALDVAPRVPGAELRVRYGLDSAAGMPSFAGAVRDTPSGIAAFDRLMFTGRAEHPMRVSVQLRAGNQRWRRSVYLDTGNQQRTVFFDEMTPVGTTATFRPPLEEVRSVLFVVDTVNTKPGASGLFWIQDAAFGSPTTSAPSAPSR
jgi:hypothetical protein